MSPYLVRKIKKWQYLCIEYWNIIAWCFLSTVWFSFSYNNQIGTGFISTFKVQTKLSSAVEGLYQQFFSSIVVYRERRVFLQSAHGCTCRHPIITLSVFINSLSSSCLWIPHCGGIYARAPTPIFFFTSPWCTAFQACFHVLCLVIKRAVNVTRLSRFLFELELYLLAGVESNAGFCFWLLLF